MNVSALGQRGRVLWDEIAGQWELGPHEQRVLYEACCEADLIARIDAEIAMGPLIARGAQGQPVAAPLITEVRQHRATMARLIAQLKLPVDDGKTAGETAEEISMKARAAANARWSQRGA